MPELEDWDEEEYVKSRVKYDKEKDEEVQRQTEFARTHLRSHGKIKVVPPKLNRDGSHAKDQEERDEE
jgi:hypothetical protein